MDVKQIRLSSSLNDADFIAWANETVYVLKTYFVSYRTIRNVLFLVDKTTSTQTCNTIAAFMQQVDPLAHQMLLIPGDESGAGGGVDLAHPEAQFMINTLLQQGICTQEQINAILDLARIGHKRYEEWGYRQFGQIELNALSLPLEEIANIRQTLPDIDFRIPFDGGYEVVKGNIYLRYMTLPTIEKLQADIAKTELGVQ